VAVVGDARVVAGQLTPAISSASCPI